MSERGGGKKSRAHAGTEFRGVCCRPGGRFGAKIHESKGKCQTWIGTFDTAEDAARAFDAAAVKMHGAAAKTNFRQPAAADDGGVSVRAEPSGHDGPTRFRGVSRQSTGRFGARISKGRAETWLGTFDTAEEAARAYDAAAVEAFGARAITNFRQPAAADDDGVSGLLAERSGPCVHRNPSGGEHIALAPGGFDGPDMRPVYLPAAERQQADYLLKDMLSTDDRELIKAAVILQHISLAGYGELEMAAEQTNW